MLASKPVCHPPRQIVVELMSPTSSSWRGAFFCFMTVVQPAVLIAVALSIFAAAPQTSRPGPEGMRARALDAWRTKVPGDTLSHALAVEAIMRELAVAKTDDKDEWGLAGLLHDIDIGTTANDLTRHGAVGAQIL